jgi:hypothetical protein
MFGLSAVALALTAFGAQADVLPVQNLTFNQLTHPFDPANSQKDFFNSVQPLDWSVGTDGANGTLTYVGQQGSEGFQGGSGNVYPVYTNPGSVLRFRPEPTSFRLTAIRNTRTRSFRPFLG